MAIPSGGRGRDHLADFARFYFMTEADTEAFRRRWMTG